MYPGVLPRTLTTLSSGVGHCIIWSSIIFITLFTASIIKTPKVLQKKLKSALAQFGAGLGYKTSTPFRRFRSLVSWSSWRRPHQEYSACPHDEDRRLLAVPRLLCCPPSNYFSIDRNNKMELGSVES